MKRLFKLLLVGVLAAGVNAPQESYAAGMKLWTKQFASSGKCRGYSGTAGVENFGTHARGFKWPMPKGSAVEFIDRTVRHLNAAAAGGANDKGLRERLLAAAKQGAYTKNDFGAAYGASPSFEQSVMIRAIAHAVSYLRSRNALSGADMKTIDTWVRALLKTQKQRATSKDHKVSTYSSEIAWGAAIGDKNLFKSGYSKLDRFLGALRSKPYFDKNVRVNNEVMPVLLMGVHVLRLNGIDLFSKQYGKYSLHDAVAHHANWVNQTGIKKVKTADPTEPARALMYSDGAGTHQAWIPLYLAHFPRSAAASSVRTLHKQVKRAQNIPYYGRNMGVHSACYFGL